MIDGALAGVRAAHIAATLLLEGSIGFRVLVARAPARGEAAQDLSIFKWLELAAFAVAIVTGALWLLLVAAAIGDSSIAAAITEGTARLLLTQTQFGIAWEWRALGFLLLAVCAIASYRRRSSLISALALLLGIALAGSIAWSGHGAATPGALGDAHLALDVLHLAAAGLWLGGLPPFLIVLLTCSPDHAGRMSRRFSALATASVLILLPTGIANGWFALSGIDALTGTGYGRLLLVKISLFLLMLAFAAVNRFVLVPQLASEATARNGRNRLAIHSGCEIALGLVILGIVGVLGILNPVEHRHAASEIRLLL